MIAGNVSGGLIIHVICLELKIGKLTAGDNWMRMSSVMADRIDDSYV